MLSAGFLLALILSFSASCKKESSNISYATVDFYVYLTQPSFINLNSVGGWVYVTGGVKGIIVFRKSNDEFAAYERACPYDPNTTNARLEVDSSNVIAVDRVCGSKFNLFDNSILNGPASKSMKTYYADYDPSSSTVHVHN